MLGVDSPVDAVFQLLKNEEQQREFFARISLAVGNPSVAITRLTRVPVVVSFGIMPSIFFLTPSTAAVRGVAPTGSAR